MKRFRYRATDPQGGLRKGTLRADNRNEAARRLRDDGLIVLEIGPGSPSEVQDTPPKELEEDPFLAAVESGRDPAERKKRLWDRVDRAAFLHQLAMMFEAGIHLMPALETQVSPAKPGLKERLQEMVEDLERGSSLGLAMQMSCLFTALQVGTVRIGEESGRLGALLKLLARLEEHEVNLRRGVATQLSYPAALAFFIVIAVAFLGHLMGGVLGQFTTELGEGGLVHQAGRVLSSRWFPVVVLAGPGLTLFGLLRLWRHPGTRTALERLLVKTPRLGPMLRRMEGARLCRLLGILAASGVQADRSLALARSTTVSPDARQALQAARASLTAGSTFSEALGRSGFFGPEVVHMTAAGEEAGRLSAQLMKVAEYAETETEHFLEAATAALEPLIIAGLGLAVALVMLLTFGPIYAVIDRL